MLNLLKCSSVIRVVIIIVVVAFMTSQVTDTYAKKNHNSSHDDYSSDDSSSDDTTGGGHGNYGDCCDETQTKLDQILQGAGIACPDCPDAWSKQLTTGRFELVMNGEAVLDKETCLVWERSPDDTMRTWTSALAYCFTKKVGDRKGWRAPTIEELATLVDDTQGPPTLPSSHPFSNVQPSVYWSSTTAADNTTFAWSVYFLSGEVIDGVNKTNSSGSYVWCVRGGQGHDAY